ncbi:MAG: TssQ family T6SS-associated lipoprotein [Burkholderiales bacterium]|nr:TssQ family T6SS-associated lipoprotein [Burkholderiales bacterium]
MTRRGVWARLPAALASAACLFFAACAQTPPATASVGLLDVSGRPAEKALLDGLKAYDDAQYDTAERQFRLALALGLASAKDRAEAHKRMAFIHCAAGRLEPCEAEFRAARQADPSFALDRSEAGHPVWGPVYRKVVPN